MSKRTMSGVPYTPDQNTLTYQLSKHIDTGMSVIFSKVSGKILTLADASIADPEQRKAFKDIVRQIIEDVRYGSADDLMMSTFKILEEHLEEKPIRSTDARFINYIDSDDIGYKYTRTKK